MKRKLIYEKSEKRTYGEPWCVSWESCMVRDGIFDIERCVHGEGGDVCPGACGVGGVVPPTSEEEDFAF